jgi:hypothetical protein
MSSYIIEFANGDAPIEVDGYLDVEPTLRAKYGHRVEIGHNGDLSDGGERTLFWASKKRRGERRRGKCVRRGAQLIQVEAQMKIHILSENQRTRNYTYKGVRI